MSPIRRGGAGSVGEVSRRVAVYDLGSSSFHLLVCDVADDGRLSTVARHRLVLDLGAAVGATGGVPADRLRAAVVALGRMAERLSELHPDVVVAHGTAALRDAANQDQVVSALEGVIGVPIRILDGPEEARLCFAGQRAALWCDGGPTVGLDLGGGSIELAVGTADRIDVATSVPVGATRLRGELHGLDPLGAMGWRAVVRRATDATTSWPDLVGGAGARADRTLGSGGTIRTLARLATARARRPGAAAGASVHQVELPVGQVHDLAERLAHTTAAERRAMPGMPARRVASIAYGAAVLAAVLDQLAVDHLVVSEWGLREGTILHAAGLVAHQAVGTRRDDPGDDRPRLSPAGVES